MIDYFKRPTIVYTSIHISGVHEIGIGYANKAYFILTLKKSYKLNSEIDIESFEKILNSNIYDRFNIDHCCLCPADTSIIDRGIPLCLYHEKLQDKINRKRPKLFVKEISWNESDPMQIIFR